MYAWGGAAEKAEKEKKGSESFFLFLKACSTCLEKAGGLGE